MHHLSNNIQQPIHQYPIKNTKIISKNQYRISFNSKFKKQKEFTKPKNITKILQKKTKQKQKSLKFGFFCEQTNIFYECENQIQYKYFVSKMNRNVREDKNIENHEIWSYFQKIFEQESKLLREIDPKLELIDDN